MSFVLFRTLSRQATSTLLVFAHISKHSHFVAVLITTYTELDISSTAVVKVSIQWQCDHDNGKL